MDTDRAFKRCKPLPGEEGAGCYWIGSAIGAVASLAGGALGGDAAESAAGRQVEGYDEALDLQREIYQQQRADLEPYRRRGQEGLNRLIHLLGIRHGAEVEGVDRGGFADAVRDFTLEDFEADPGYQFRLSEGEKAINRAAAARGNYQDPRTIRELMRYNQGQADQTYNDAFNRRNIETTNRFNRMASLAGIGQTATQQTVGAAGNYGRTAGNLLTGRGDAAASGVLNAANARISGLTGAASGLAGLGGGGFNRLGFGATNPAAYTGMVGGAPNASWGMWGV